MTSFRLFRLGALLSGLYLSSSVLGACSTSMHQLRRESLEAHEPTGAPIAVSSRAYDAFLRATDYARVGELEEAERWYRRAIDLDPKATTAYLRYGEVLAEKRQFRDAIALTRRALALEPAHYEATLQLARLQRLDGRDEEAEATFKRAVELAPKKEQAYLELAGFYRVLGRPDDGLKLLSELEKVDPPLPLSALMTRAALHKDLGDLSFAEADLLSVLDQNSDAVPAQRALLDLYLLSGDLKIATRRLEEIYATHPWFVWCRETLVTLYAKQEDLEALNRHLELAEESDPELAERMRMSVVEDLARRGSYDKALAQLQPLLEETLPDEYALYYAGLLYSERDDHTKALEMFARIPVDASLHAKAVEQQAWTLAELERTDEGISLLISYLKQEPDADDIRYALVGLYVRVKRYDAAMTELELLLAKGPFNARALIQKAYLLQQTQHAEQAEALLLKAIRDHRTDLELYQALASLYAGGGKLPLAAAILQDALLVEPASIELRFALGTYLDELGQHDQAVAQMQRILELDPENADAMNFVGYTWAEQGRRLDEAEVMIKRALELSPDSGYITDSLGWVYYQSGRYAEAVKVLERAVQLIEAEPIIVEHLGDAYLKVGEKAKALEAYERAAKEISAESSPNPEDKARILGKLEALRAELGVSPSEKSP